MGWDLEQNNTKPDTPPISEFELFWNIDCNLIWHVWTRFSNCKCNRATEKCCHGLIVFIVAYEYGEVSWKSAN